MSKENQAASAPVQRLVGQRYDLEPLLHAISTIKAFNGRELASLRFYHNGKRVKKPRGSVKEWRFIGLNNVGYVKCVLLPNSVLDGSARPQQAVSHESQGRAP